MGVPFARNGSASAPIFVDRQPTLLASNCNLAAVTVPVPAPCQSRGVDHGKSRGGAQMVSLLDAGSRPAFKRHYDWVSRCAAARPNFFALGG